MDSLMAIELRRVIGQERIDVVHAHHYEGLLVSALAQVGRKRRPVVYDAHTLLESELPFYGPPLARKLVSRVGRRIDGWLPSRADHVVAVTEQIKGILVRVGRIPEERVTVAPNGVELARFAKSVGATGHRPTASAPVFTLGYTGNLAAYQGIGLLLQATKNVLAVRRDVRLLIATGSPTEKWRSEVKRLGLGQHVDFTSDNLDTLPEVLVGFDIALNPRPRCEGIPYKLLNYIAAGKPVVSFRGSARGVAEDAVLTVPDGDTSAFAAAILRLLDDPALARSLGRRARRAAEEDHSWERTAEGVEGVYMRMLGLTNESCKTAGGAR
jgi:glycosyltransferase involved in cell wall biosynthesis